MSELQDIKAYIDSDNQDALAMFNGLRASLDVSLERYPLEVNLLGVYFFEVLKLLTQSHFKKREQELGRAPVDDDITRRLAGWPYLGYRDISEGFDFDDKRYGKDVSVSHPGSWPLLQAVSNLKAGISGGGAAKIAILSPGVDQKANLWRDSWRLKTSLIELPRNWFAVPQFEDQLRQLTDSVAGVMADCSHKLPVDIINGLLERHIRANCSEGMPAIELAGDKVLLKSGIELSNRMIGQVALQQGLPVINVMHGEAFGVCDEPTFSDVGEHAYSSAVLGYGPEVEKGGNSYQYGLQGSCQYLQSSGAQVSQYYRPGYQGLSIDPDRAAFFYYPTTLSGASHRYGPYRDTADSNYIAWQTRLVELFGRRLKFKSHPKEKYLSENLFPENEQKQGGFSELMDQIDVFVFDYIGTAFNVACATDKPIIYFDLGIRNIHSRALDEVKQRTAYFDIADGMPSLDDVFDKLRFTSRENSYPVKYSLAENRCSRMEALSRFLTH